MQTRLLHTYPLLRQLSRYEDYATIGRQYGRACSCNVILTIMPLSFQGFTAHDYPYARNCDITDYLNKQYVTGGMAHAMAGVAAVAANSNLRPGTLLVVEETAGSYGGGANYYRPIRDPP